MNKLGMMTDLEWQTEETHVEKILENLFKTWVMGIFEVKLKVEFIYFLELKFC